MTFTVFQTFEIPLALVHHFLLGLISTLARFPYHCYGGRHFWTAHGVCHNERGKFQNTKRLNRIESSTIIPSRTKTSLLYLYRKVYDVLLKFHPSGSSSDSSSVSDNVLWKKPQLNSEWETSDLSCSSQFMYTSSPTPMHFIPARNNCQWTTTTRTSDFVSMVLSTVL